MKQLILNKLKAGEKKIMTKRERQLKQYIKDLKDKEIAITYVDMKEEEISYLLEYANKLDFVLYEESKTDPKLLWMGTLAYNLRVITNRAKLNKERVSND